MDEMKHEKSKGNTVRSLSKLSLKAGESWHEMLGDEAKKPQSAKSSKKLETEIIEPEVIVRIESTATFFWDEQKFLSQKRRPLSGRQHENQDYNRTWFYEKGLSPLPQ